MNTLYFKRSTKNILLSGAIHGLFLGSLWWATDNFSFPEEPTPTLDLPIDATILPPSAPPEPTKQSHPKTSTTHPPISHAPTAKTTHKNLIPHPEKSTVGKKSGEVKTITPIDPNGMQAPIGQKGANDTGLSKNNANASSATPEPNTAAHNSVPIAINAKTMGSFSIQYDMTGDAKGFNAMGSATLSFSHTDSSYIANLSSKASLAKMFAESKGEIRGDSLATVKFKDFYTISMFGLSTPEKVGTNFKVYYDTKQINFNGTGGDAGLEPLTENTIYDYLSAIVYVQAVLQQHSEKRSAGQTFTLPVGKRKKLGTAIVTIQPRDPEPLSTHEGRFNAIPVKIQLSSGSVNNIEIWFAPEKNYCPLQIDLGFKSGKARLISRTSRCG